MNIIPPPYQLFFVTSDEILLLTYSDGEPVGKSDQFLNESDILDMISTMEGVEQLLYIKPKSAKLCRYKQTKRMYRGICKPKIPPSGRGEYHHTIHANFRTTAMN
ncbi:hypothetical protein [Bartonella sp. DGB2]|uniref:hypothetical protein n=1 Tax=Bartonella sp. DGB2 TaxID=3388426 RepID=UPI00398FAEFD